MLFIFFVFFFINTLEEIINLLKANIMNKFIILLFAMGLGLISCESDYQDEITEEPILSENAVNAFASKINFFDDYAVPVEKDSVQKLKRVLLQNYDGVNRIIDNSEGEIEGVLYDVVRSADSVHFKNFHVNAPKSGGPVSDIEWDMLAWKCPDGQSLVDTCYSEDCVKETLSDLADNFSFGETITMHHSGIAGVKICADVK